MRLLGCNRTCPVAHKHAGNEKAYYYHQPNSSLGVVRRADVPDDIEVRELLTEWHLCLHGWSDRDLCFTGGWQALGRERERLCAGWRAGRRQVNANGQYAGAA